MEFLLISSIMSSNKENIEEEINSSISFEKETRDRVAKLKESLIEDPHGSTTTVFATTVLQKEQDDIFLDGCSESVSTLIKDKAVTLRQSYHSFDFNGKAIITLGLNSILDLSFKYPAAQAKLFKRNQRKQLDALFPSKTYPVDSYDYIKELLASLNGCYNKNKSKEANWTTIYKELKRLDNIYDHERDISHNDTGFCVHFLLHIMSIIKHQPHLFLEEVDTSEWDYIVGFWGVVSGRLFHGSGLHLKWGDTHLTVYDTVSDLILKVDLRILHDRIRQGQNVETDIGAMEAAEEQPGDAKYTFDRCKVLLESKAMIDRFLLDGCLVDSVDSLQICGLEAHFVNLTLEAPGAYIGTQFYTGCIGNSMSNIVRHLDLAIHLLCFRDQCISVMNQCENHLSEARSRKVSAKRSYSQLPRDDLVVKQESVRGSWNPPRSSKSPPPPTPENLFGKH
ncbi:hypothetical protein MFLAVUS_006884 [Mucor flavus]|uniref:Uncharacterized protein n=1 Tax=Mucor flavus TaxID=439312 RepID=A0ABP9Z2T2_9FUNG